ncbi:hypothetical protein [Crocinitomix catalasitica]|uniref:hypothetical protein n=1 Tax=Crocinitomix catalasitica TaxID=184607 RepID=UPI000480DCF4|nr:hypothetical protein [Crocinitomix catalasitica]
MGLLISHLLLNPEIFTAFNALFPLSEDVNETEKVVILKQEESRIKKYEQKYNSKTQNELEDIVNGNAYVVEAVEAAKRLLKQF